MKTAKVVPIIEGATWIENRNCEEGCINDVILYTKEDLQKLIDRLYKEGNEILDSNNININNGYGIRLVIKTQAEIVKV